MGMFLFTRGRGRRMRVWIDSPCLLGGGRDSSDAVHGPAELFYTLNLGRPVRTLVPLVLVGSLQLLRKTHL